MTIMEKIFRSEGEEGQDEQRRQEEDGKGGSIVRSSHIVLTVSI